MGTNYSRRGMSKMNKLLLRYSMLIVVAALASAAFAAVDEGHSAPGRQYHFKILQGAGAPVCDAFLKRLNTAHYVTPPYCGLPEETSVPGFTPLHRVPLTAAEAVMMKVRITDFMRTQQQHTKGEYEAKREAEHARMKYFPKVPSRQEDITRMQALIQDGEIVAWRYKPRVDIDNNGELDDVLVWQGLGVGETTNAVCGHPVTTTHFETDGRVPQVAFILTPSNNPLDVPIDVKRTKQVFGYSGAYIHPGQSFPDKRFRPLGPTIGIFKYRNVYYFHTFLFNHPIRWWGFLTNKQEYDPSQANTLAVFLRQQDKTEQVCQYRMTEAE